MPMILSSLPRMKKALKLPKIRLNNGCQKEDGSLRKTG